jgi:hypothetical protein
MQKIIIKINKIKMTKSLDNIKDLFMNKKKIEIKLTYKMNIK